ncbi:MAG TPA: 1,4-alpha-glucan branching protein domain-containing protein [Gemmatimonadales bacterium]|jgi:1,4-alpha-glucan branching enzyme|nr:1,4-alpha-glucan branching protein domain-containing protein [Gemmatimonadales bacterium]
MTSRPMDFVFALHSHLPYVLNHGRWPHGSDWLCEAALDTYLPLLEELRSLAAENVPASVTIGFTPVLANQLTSPLFVTEMEAFFDQRFRACDEAPASLATTGDSHLVPLVQFWRTRLVRLRELFHSIGQDLIGAFRTLEADGRLEIIGSAATHGYLPLLARDESIRLQLAVGVSEHRRLFGRAPTGCWLPECAYRPRGAWEPWPTAPRTGMRRGIEEHLADAGFQFFFVDAHLAAAGRPLGLSGDPAGDPIVHAPAGRTPPGEPHRSPYRAYRVAHGPVTAYVRDPRASMQVWSRFEGYPGDEWYLEFHKMRWPGGLKLWRVSGPGVDLGAKQPYNPDAAFDRARGHAEHFAHLLAGIAAGQSQNRDGVVVAPFDTELFGHWWFEGPVFLGGMYRSLVRQREAIHPATGSRHLRAHPARAAIRLPWGSWGANGDSSMWLSDRTAWTWERLWPLEQAFWDAAPNAIASPAARPVLAQAAREMLLAQSSDWQFIISTGAAADYAEKRFQQHCRDAEQLIAALAPGAEASMTDAQRRAEELAQRDQLFPDVIPAVAAALGGSRSLVLG